MELNRLMITAAVAAALVSPAQATDILEEVIVTAQKREQSINDVSMSITAVSGDVARAMDRGVGHVVPDCSCDPGSTCAYCTPTGVPILLAHEMAGVGQEARHGCEFEAFFNCHQGARSSQMSSFG